MSSETGDRRATRFPPLPEFDAEARRIFESVPERYREGVDSLRVREATMPHPSLAGVFTLGECRVLDWASPLGSEAELHSEVVLYYGSFRRLAREDPEFRWAEELWETITHEIQHHLEFRGLSSVLEQRDYADDQSYRMAAGEPFDPEFYRYGEPVDAGIYRVGDDWYIEGRIPSESGDTVLFDWQGATFRLQLDEGPGRMTFVRVVGFESGPGELWVVARTRRGPGHWFRRLLGALEPLPAVTRLESEAEPVDGDGD